MSNNLTDLNEYLFDQLDRLSVNGMTPEQQDAEIKRSEAMVRVSDQITKVAALRIQAAKTYAEHGGAVLDMLPQIGGEKK